MRGRLGCPATFPRPFAFRVDDLGKAMSGGSWSGAGTRVGAKAITTFRATRPLQRAHLRLAQLGNAATEFWREDTRDPSPTRACGHRAERGLSWPPGPGTHRAQARQREGASSPGPRLPPHRLPACERGRLSPPPPGPRLLP